MFQNKDAFWKGNILIFFFFGHGKQRVNLSSSTRDRTHGEAQNPNHWTPREVPAHSF